MQIPSTLNRLVDVRVPAGTAAPEHPGGLLALPARPKLAFSSTRFPVLSAKLPFSATHLGVVWSGSGRPSQIRTSPNGHVWTAWQQVQDEPDMFDERSGNHYSGLLPGRRARFAQLRLSEGSDVRRLKLAVINTQAGPRKTVRLTRSASAATPGPKVIGRAAWGADEAIRRGEGSFTRAKRIFLHHTNTPNNDADPAGTIRAIYSYHVRTRGFHDIGYNYLIDHRGRVFEGRRATPASGGESQPGEDSNGFSVLGAHTKDHNAGSIGIALLGNSDSAAPTPDALGSLIGLSAWAADRHGIDPLGKHLRADPVTGIPQRLFNIAGHKDSGGSITHCPGAVLSSQLPAIRKRVEEAIVSAGAETPPAMPTGTTMAAPSPSTSMTPNAEGDVSRTAVKVDLMFQDKQGVVHRTVSVAPSGGSFSVTDASFREDPLSPGVYSIRAVAFDAQGRASPAALVSDGYELRRPSALPALDAIVAPVLSPPLANAGSGALADAMATVIKVLGL